MRHLVRVTRLFPAALRVGAGLFALFGETSSQHHQQTQVGETKARELAGLRALPLLAKRVDVDAAAKPRSRRLGRSLRQSDLRSLQRRRRRSPDHLQEMPRDWHRQPRRSHEGGAGMAEGVG